MPLFARWIDAGLVVLHAQLYDCTGDRLIGAIVPKLQTSALTMLGLHAEHLTTGSIVSLCAALERNTRLQCLEIIARSWQRGDRERDLVPAVVALVRNNYTLDALCLRVFPQWLNGWREPICDALVGNRTLRHFCTGYACEAIDALTRRNAVRVHWRTARRIVTDVCLAFAPFEVTTYVLSWIVD